jgi:metal-responsive CopG/Arc/MetJ family transcriptional regulator
MKNSVPTEPVSISIQISLLDRVDRYCNRRDLNRSQVFQRAMKRFLAAELAEDPSFWEQIYQNTEENSK